MREIQVEQVIDSVKKLCLEKAYHLPKDIKEAIDKAALNEEELPKYILEQCKENYKIADEEEFPLCQDTGTALFFVEIGEEVYIKGNLNDAINEGVRQAYKEGFLRKSIVDEPIFDRVNTKDNTPAIIYFDFVKGDKIKIYFLAKGGGAENCAGLGMLMPSQGSKGVVDFVVETVKKAGGKPCPPVIVGVGCGGTADYAAVLSKKALLIKTGQRNKNENYSKMELEILEKVNDLNIGPQGLGGKTTALEVHIEYAPCHIASMPCFVTLNCHSARHGEVII
ncbi:MAG: fumarate hydratase [Lachnospiraceae bacterium]|jgi:fumarate hydratase subunit alpha|nr:fumarate hydratase [Lachnospiraceae bacterium]